jgi:hypothetical protein
MKTLRDLIILWGCIFIGTGILIIIFGSALYPGLGVTGVGGLLISVVILKETYANPKPKYKAKSNDHYQGSQSKTTNPNYTPENAGAGRYKTAMEEKKKAGTYVPTYGPVSVHSTLPLSKFKDDDLGIDISDMTPEEVRELAKLLASRKVHRSPLFRG